MHAAAFKTYLGLVYQLELVALQGSSQPLGRIELLRSALEQLGTECAELIATLLLGTEERSIRSFHQQLSRAPVLRIATESRAQGDQQLAPLHFQGRSERRNDFGAVVGELLLGLAAGVYNRKLVPTDARYESRGPDERCQPSGHRAQQL